MAAPIDLLDTLLIFDEFDALVAYLMPDERDQVTYDATKPKFHLQDLTDAQSKAFFRFPKADIYRLVNALRVPAEIVLSNRCVVGSEFAICVLLARLAYPNRLVELEKIFNRPKTTLSMIASAMVDHVYDNFNRKLIDLNQEWLQNRFQTYADAIHLKGAPLRNCIGFVDGTVRPVCRPTRFQRVCFNGHKRIHAIKFQSIVVPDGMIANLYGPLEGRRHDSALLNYSGVLQQFEEGQWRDEDGRMYCIYGDPAYPIREFLLAPYRGGQLDEWQTMFNQQMSSVRESMEWQFGKILSLFAFLDFRKNLKVLLQPVAKYYLVGALLTNCHTCLYGSQTGTYFEMDPPTLEEYLS